MTLDAFFKRAENQYDNLLPFVVYRKPNEVVLKGILQQNDELFFTSEFTEKGFVFSPFDDANKTVILPIEVSETMSTDFVMSSTSIVLSTRPVETPRINTSEKRQHIHLVEKGIESIENNTLKKVVLSRKEIIEISETNPITIFEKLLSRYVSAFVYCWYHPKVGLWLGATPETLVKIEGTRFSMMALAGTQNYKGTLDVVWQEKEIQEQQFVTDFIIENLKPSVDKVTISETETVKAGNLLHLKTIISAQLKRDSILKNVISVLHPTPAVCGAPKLKAKQFILKHENYNREFYTGFLGELNFDTTIAPRSGRRNIENRAYAVNRKSTQLYVNLRCMQIKDQLALVYVGGGITKDSVAENEWEETVAKSLVIKTVLS